MAEVERGLASIADRVTGTTDLEMVVPELIDLLGGDGKALRALKMVRERRFCLLLLPAVKCACWGRSLLFALPKGRCAGVPCH